MRKPVRLLGYCIAGVLFSATAAAQQIDVEAQFEQEKQYCATLPEPSRSACLREAAAVHQEIVSGKRTASNDSYRLNRVTRCERLPVEQRDSCLKLMSENTQPDVRGSVQGGGVMRELTIEIPAPAQAAPAPSTAPPAPSPATPLPLESGR